MYTLPTKLRLFAIIFMVVGAMGIVFGFLAVPGSTAEVKEMMATTHGENNQATPAHAEEHTESALEEHREI